MQARSLPQLHAYLRQGLRSMQYEVEGQTRFRVLGEAGMMFCAARVGFWLAASFRKGSSWSSVCLPQTDGDGAIQAQGNAATDDRSVVASL